MPPFPCEAIMDKSDPLSFCMAVAEKAITTPLLQCGDAKLHLVNHGVWHYIVTGPHHTGFAAYKRRDAMAALADFMDGAGKEPGRVVHVNPGLGLDPGLVGLDLWPARDATTMREHRDKPDPDPSW